eukprot:SAG31_NODE_30_length_32545_cov_9.378999_38_plen_257_part_00
MLPHLFAASLRQNRNFKVTTVTGRCFHVRVPGVDASDHGQVDAVVHANSLHAATAGAVLIITMANLLLSSRSSMQRAQGLIDCLLAGLAPTPRYFGGKSGLLVSDFIDGSALVPSALKRSPDLLRRVVTTIKTAHEQIPHLAPSRASDFLYGYDLQLLEAWHGQTLFAKAKQLQAVLARSIGHFDEVVSCHQDLTPANIVVENASDSGKVWIIDWEWAGPGDRLADLATFCALSDQVSDDFMVWTPGLYTTSHGHF